MSSKIPSLKLRKLPRLPSPSRIAASMRATSMVHDSLATTRSKAPLRPFDIQRTSEAISLENSEVKGPRRTASMETLPNTYRSAVLQKKLDLVVGFKAEMERGSRWKKTQTVLRLLEKLAGEDGVYREEMQQIVQQLRLDLFHPLSSLPHPIRRVIEATHIEAFLSDSVPFHALTEALLAQVASLESDLAHTSAAAENAKSSLQQQLSTTEGEVRILQLRIQKLESGAEDEIDPLDQLKGELSKASEQYMKLQKKLAKGQKREEDLTEELTLKNEMLKNSVEEGNKLRHLNQELRTTQNLQEAKLTKLREKTRNMKLHLADAVSMWKIASGKINSLEHQLKLSENESIALRERAAAAFDELTPRPDWTQAGISLATPDGKKPSKDCFQELLKQLEVAAKNAVKAATTVKHKGKKLAIPNSERAIFSGVGTPAAGEVNSSAVSPL